MLLPSPPHPTPPHPCPTPPPLGLLRSSLSSAHPPAYFWHLPSTSPILPFTLPVPPPTQPSPVPRAVAFALLPLPPHPFCSLQLLSPPFPARWISSLLPQIDGWFLFGRLPCLISVATGRGDWARKRPPRLGPDGDLLGLREKRDNKITLLAPPPLNKSQRLAGCVCV